MWILQGSKPRPGDKRKSGVQEKDKKRIKSDGGERPRGFERRLDPERIVGATDSSGELMFLIKVICEGSSLIRKI